jgi:AcrR family transcriptional regulator
VARLSKNPAPKRRVKRNAADSRLSTRQTLLEAAGQVFAEKGYEGATAKEICRRAGANAAAVNYHFGGIAPLYAAVLEEARRRIFSAQAIAHALEGKSDPRDKLEAAVGVIVRALLRPAVTSWAVRIFGRDLISLSPTADAFKEKLALPRARLMRRLVGSLMKLPDDDPVVAMACLNLMAPICTLILADRRMLRRALPGLDLSADNSEAVARSLARYALAGLAATPR